MKLFIQNAALAMEVFSIPILLAAVFIAYMARPVENVKGGR